MPAAVYRGPFARRQAERLLWRADFGPRRGEAEALAKLGLEGAVRTLTRPRAERFLGAAPRDDKGRALAPTDAWATPTSGGSTGWSAPPARSSSG